MSTKVRTRFAPSPTGYLHVGGARTALYSWLFAKKMQGDFILRVEDTDQERSTEESLQMVLSDLKWLGYEWQEGPEVGGANQPYFQSQRLAIYKEHAERLLQSAKAYYCFCSDERLETLREEAIAKKQSPQYDGHCRHLSKEDIEARFSKGETATVRFKIPQEKDFYVFNDLIRKEVKFPKDMVGDFVILRSGGMPVYNFCCAVDDALMNVTHVLRAEEHLSNTLRQIMLYEAFDYPLPYFGHLSIILGEDKQKLSKRHGATSCNEYKERGYLPEALTNFLALLGWSHPESKEIMSIEEMASAFSIERIHGSPAVFDETKLKWMNAQYLRALDNKDLWQRLQPFLLKAGLDFSKMPSEWQDNTLNVFKSSMETLLDAVNLYKYLSDENFKIDTTEDNVFAWDTTRPVIQAWIDALENHAGESISEEEFNALQNKVKEQVGVKGKQLFMPIRVAVIGVPHGAELKLLIPLMAKSSLLERAKKVLASG